MNRLITRLWGTFLALGLGVGLGAQSAMALVIPRADLKAGWSLGFMPSNLAADYSFGNLSVGMTMTYVSPSYPDPTYQTSRYFDPGVRFTVVGARQPNYVMGFVGALTQQTAFFPERSPDRSIIMRTERELAGDAGVCGSYWYGFKAFGDRDFKLLFAPTLTGGLKNDGTFVVGNSTGYDIGLRLDDWLELLLNNQVILQQQVVGVRMAL